MKKKIIVLLILLGFGVSDSSLLAYANAPFQGHVEETNINPREAEEKLLEGW